MYQIERKSSLWTDLEAKYTLEADYAGEYNKRAVLGLLATYKEQKTQKNFRNKLITISVVILQIFL